MYKYMLQCMFLINCYLLLASYLSSGTYRNILLALLMSRGTQPPGPANGSTFAFRALTLAC